MAGWTKRLNPGLFGRFASAGSLAVAASLLLSASVRAQPGFELTGLIEERWNSNHMATATTPGVQTTPCGHFDYTNPAAPIWVPAPLQVPPNTFLKSGYDMERYSKLQPLTGTSVLASYDRGTCDFAGQTNGIMDQRCVPSSTGTTIDPININLDLGRYAGPTQSDHRLRPEVKASLVADGLLAPQATIRLQFRCKGLSPNSPYIGGWPSGVIVKLNGKPCSLINPDNAPEPVGPSGYVLPTARRWRTALLSCDVGEVHFPDEPGTGGNKPTPQQNQIEIDFSGVTQTPPFSGPDFCIVIGDAELNVKVYSPVVLVHGIGANAGWWQANGFKQYLDQHYVYHQALNFSGVSQVAPGSSVKRDFLLDITRETINAVGGSSIAFGCHSMGGLDTLDFLVSTNNLAITTASAEKRVVTSMTTFSSPFKGSAMAGLIDDCHSAYVNQINANPITHWVNVDSNLNGIAAQVAIDFTADVFRPTDKVPSGWLLLAPKQSTPFSSQRASLLRQPDLSVFVNTTAADADKNSNERIEVSGGSDDEGGSILSGVGGAVLEVGNTILPNISSRPLTNAYNIVRRDATFTIKATIENDVEYGTSKYFAISTTLRDPAQGCDIVVNSTSAFAEGISPSLADFAGPLWSGQSEGRNHTNMLDQQAAARLFGSIRFGDGRSGEFR